MMIVPTSTMNWMHIIAHRNRRCAFAGGIRPRSKKANDIRPNPGDKIEKNSHKYTHLIVYTICKGRDSNASMCCPKPQEVEIVRNMLSPSARSCSTHQLTSERW